VTFAGEIQDSPTGLFYLSARYYDPSLGRVYALDVRMGSLLSPQTLNRHVYCGSSPLLLTDLMGMDWWSDLGTIVLIGAFVLATVITAGFASPLAAIACGAAFLRLERAFSEPQHTGYAENDKPDAKKPGIEIRNGISGYA